MKQKIKVIPIAIACLALLSFAIKNDNPESESHGNSLLAVDSKKLDVNNISTWYRNNGSFNRDPATGNSGFEWPKSTSMYARFASGLWLGAVVQSDTLIAIAEYDYEYLPGYVDNGGVPQGTDNPLYRIYTILRGDTTSADYLAWPANQGAYLNSNNKPFFLGTQTMFYSYTDGYASSHGNPAGSTAPLKAVILQTNWAYTNVGLPDVNYMEFRIINRNNLAWEKAYISIWTDDDLGDAVDDAVGVDTVMNLGYTYNFDNSDSQYGANPPAVGFVVLRGPLVPSPGDTVRRYNPPGSNNLVTIPNHKEVSLSSFNMYTNADPSIGDPSNFKETYYNLQGLKRDGTQWINPINNQPTKFVYSGDPVAPTGWNQTNGNDRRSLMTFGPITMNPGDTQSIIIGQVIARGSSNLNSITNLRSLSGYVKQIYNTNFQSVLSVKNISDAVPEEFRLEQNYPNPFNPSTKIRYMIKENGLVTLKVFDALGNEVASLVNENQSAGSYEAEFSSEITSKLSSGIYFYKLTAGRGFSDTKRMILIK